MPDVGNLETREVSQTGAIQIAGLDHLVLRVADLDRARDVAGGDHAVSVDHGQVPIVGAHLDVAE